jgi:hypothetical protein
MKKYNKKGLYSYYRGVKATDEIWSQRRSLGKAEMS